MLIMPSKYNSIVFHIDIVRVHEPRLPFDIRITVTTPESRGAVAIPPRLIGTTSRLGGIKLIPTFCQPTALKPSDTIFHTLILRPIHIPLARSGSYRSSRRRNNSRRRGGGGGYTRD